MIQQRKHPTEELLHLLLPISVWGHPSIIHYTFFGVWHFVIQSRGSVSRHRETLFFRGVSGARKGKDSRTPPDRETRQRGKEKLFFAFSDQLR